MHEECKAFKTYAFVLPTKLTMHRFMSASLEMEFRLNLTAAVNKMATIHQINRSEKKIHATLETYL
jgi:hypothetical protein